MVMLRRYGAVIRVHSSRAKDYMAMTDLGVAYRNTDDPCHVGATN
jgi:hypothetical protein